MVDYLSEQAAAQLVEARIHVDGTDFALSVTRADARSVYIPLAADIVALATQQHTGRYMVGIAGPPGAGKSSFAAILRRAILALDARLGPIVVPFDGFHYPNSYLDSRMVPNTGGQAATLRSIKGQPATFDAARGVRLLMAAKRDEIVDLPIYSRDLHEPVENALALDADCRLCIVEGNYIYSDDSPWCEIRELFDIRLFISAPTDTLKQRLLERHIRGGRERASAEEHYNRVDLANIRIVAPTRQYAHIAIEHSETGLSIPDEYS